MFIKIEDTLINPDRINSITMGSDAEGNYIVVNMEGSTKKFRRETFEQTVELYEKLQQIFGGVIAY